MNTDIGGTGGRPSPFLTRKRQIFSLVASFIAILILVIGFFTLTEKIEPGYKGVVYSLNGGLKDKVLGQGLQFIWPWEEVTQYPVSTETVYLTKAHTEGSPGDDSFNINTYDGKSVNVDVVYSYKMESSKLPHIFTKFRRQTHEQIQASYLKTQIKTVMQEVSTNYSVLGVYAEKRDEITKEMQRLLTDRLKVDGIIIENFSLSDVRPDKQTLKSLQAIADAQNKQEFLKREQKNKEQEAINAKIEAEGKKKVAIVNAEADAEQTRIRAEAQAKANELLTKSMTPAIIQDNWIKKWNGAQPYVNGGSNSIIQMPADLFKQDTKK
ncbi:prohibitin family protein [Neobacillus sp. PS3-34]|uniref:prohibitin family protein n=1 Tax=Neobacillus sp. PS3-34 TaxID=3070678 RepID=UPI0027E0E819|nr:prohibitin family protein [Neobacillus sp. PS3-34]WML48799.1 prohibitin family protein [Neobacillus sp. PS3-34]